LLRSLLPYWLPELPSDVARDAGQHTWDSFLGSLDHVVLEFDLGTMTQQLLSVPILILQGDRDENADPEALKHIAHVVGGRFVRLEGDHNFLLRRPEPALGMIRSFLAD
jgi:pimeloyl-ACP methyl ester carboxylesterase